MAEKAVLGIDISKATFDVFLKAGDESHAGQFDNSVAGFKQLKKWLRTRKAGRVHACMEATGAYGVKLCNFLYDEGHEVSVVNPLRVKRYGESDLRRNRTDNTDARLIADFCLNMKTSLWEPPSEEVLCLQSLTRRIESLQKMRLMESNRMDTAPEQVKGSIARIISSIDREIKEVEKLIKKHFDDHPDLRHKKDLLESIPGIGEKSARLLLSEILFERFESAKQVAAQAGLTPSREQSGTTLDKTRISKIGNPRIRRALLFPAMAAIKHNAVVSSFAARLERNGLTPMQVVCASKRKLLHIAFGVIKNDRPFDPNFAQVA
ncbi:MAG: IS110 family transposase [Aridibacter famidurans]|nr:IS110 family transposase [Aridibacter famidurans]